MLLKAVLFDFDGTLADTLPAAFHAFQEVFARYDQRTVTVEELVAMFGPTEDQILETHLANKAALPQAIEDFYEIYSRKHAEGMTPDRDILFLLRFLKERDIRVGIVTGKSRRALDISSEALQLTGLWDVAVTGEDTERPKPHPEGIRKALSALGATEDEALFLGDSHADIAAGQAAGIRTFGVSWMSVSQSPDLQTWTVFSHVQDFWEILQELL
ncbi:HAD family hydrolase [Gorillibacterium sp. sgz5001074]|uniref:HAD family hydrolase n=1 Tax=Gorillibacterium sp. sgz5001074 TaxID=3446695 RepID=UPI003F66C550